jgi:xylulokinase
MSLLGIDIGTTGCKAVVFSLAGEPLAKSYRDYEILSEKESFAELNSYEVWDKIMDTVRDVAVLTTNDPIQALSVSSLGEAMVPVSKGGKILGNSILGIDHRGMEFIELIRARYSSFEFFNITGNLPGIFYSMPKIAWIKKYQPDLYFNTDYFLTWADFVCYMLGGKPVTNFSLAGRTLLFDIHKCKWSNELLDFMDLDKSKLAAPHPSGSTLGFVCNDLAKKLHLNNGVSIISGGHDQCCAALGSGIKSDSSAAMYGMGTFICVVPVFSEMPDINYMFENKLHIEHHVVPGSFISFIFNQSGGALVKWFKQTFTFGLNDSIDQQRNYNDLFNEIPDKSTDILVTPRFGTTGPPDFLTGNQGCIAGLSLSHTRGDILRAILEGMSFYVRDCFEKLEKPFSGIYSLKATGGGSVSDKWLQITSDILGKPITVNEVGEASSLGAAIIAGKGANVFASFDIAIDLMVHKKLTINPDLSRKEYYARKFEQYKLFTNK